MVSRAEMISSPQQAQIFRLLFARTVARIGEMRALGRFMDDSDDAVLLLNFGEVSGIAVEYVDYCVYHNCGSFYLGLCWILAKLRWRDECFNCRN